MKKIVWSMALLLSLSGCDQLAQIAEQAGQTSTTLGPPTQSQIADGIREALIVGATNSVLATSKVNGFYGNSLIKIPFPPEAQKVEKAARDLGLGKQVDEFIETMNHGAEQASAKAKPIFVNAIKQMTLTDVYNIWRGENDAATQYLMSTTRPLLENEFRPVIKTSLDQVEVTKYWNPLVSSYNKLPFVTPVNANLDEYVLNEAMDGLFLIIAQEEAKIREDPAARVTDILKRVFGYNDQL
jgi:hypothetical protein